MAIQLAANTAESCANRAMNAMCEVDAKIFDCCFCATSTSLLKVAASCDGGGTRWQNADDRHQLNQPRFTTMDKFNDSGIAILRRRQLLTGTAAMGLCGHALANIGFTGRMVTRSLGIEGHYVGQFVAANANAADIIGADIAALFGPQALFSNTDVEDVRAVFGADLVGSTRTLGLTVTVSTGSVQETVHQALAAIQADTATLLCSVIGLLVVIAGPSGKLNVADLWNAGYEMRARLRPSSARCAYGMVTDDSLTDRVRVSAVLTI